MTTEQEVYMLYEARLVIKTSDSHTMIEFATGWRLPNNYILFKLLSISLLSLNKANLVHLLQRKISLNLFTSKVLQTVAANKS